MSQRCYLCPGNLPHFQLLQSLGAEVTVDVERLGALEMLINDVADFSR